jgi:selenocysteine lyase/cysteine desulfurase
VLHFCHITNVTGQLFPVQRLSRLARSRGILTIVDGAHAGAHFPFTLRDLDCDTYSVSLHKWLLAPLGTGLLFVRREHIAKFWPLQAATASADANIRKFEEIGTAPAATRAAINEALLFHQAIGAERKAARLRYLTLRWANRLKNHPRIQMHSSLDAGQTWGMATVGIRGMEAPAIASALWDKHRIIVAALRGGQPPSQSFPFQGIRVTTGVHMTLEEIDTFSAAMEDILKAG